VAESPCCSCPPTPAEAPPWFYRESILIQGAKGRLAAIGAIRAALSPLETVLRGALEAGAITPSEQAQLEALAAWARALEVEGVILEREVAAFPSQP
jgi:hypothetical protein